MLRESQILQAWESGEGRLPAEQALCLLRYGYPERSLAQLLSLSVGERDTLLFALREQAFGPSLQGTARCPSCKEQSLFSVPLSALRISASPSISQTFPLDCEGLQILFRLPTVSDLRQAAQLAEVEAVRSFLIRCCIVSVSRGQESIQKAAWNQLPAQVERALAEALSAHDPQSEVLLALCCAHCGHSFSALFDIVRFLWTELSARAERLFQEIDALARVYGWTESEILQLGPARRRRYLELVSHE